MTKAKRWLKKMLGERRFLSVTSKVFHQAFERGLLKNNPMYAAHYFVHHLISKNDTVIDLGANLGYYAVHFAKLVGSGGRVFAVEPIPLYRSVLEDNLKTISWVKVLPFALGEKEEKIAMGNPGEGGNRHGLMHVLTDVEKTTTNHTYEVSMRHPITLFGDLEKLDYIKCDIEGYEIPVIPLMLPLIQKLQPVVQVETTQENLPELFRLFRDLNYTMYNVVKGKLVPFLSPAQQLQYDLFALPPHKLSGVQHLIAKHA